MKIAVAQLDCVPGDVAANCSHAAASAARAHENGCVAVVFPEMMDTGYEMSAIRETASSWNGAPFTHMQQVARDHSLFVICGLSEADGDRIFNSLAVFDPDGRLAGAYRKTHLVSYAPLNENQ